MSFKDRVVLITGGSGGIGGETAKLFAENGANIVVNYFSNANKAGSIVKDVRNKGVKGFKVKADVSDPKQVKDMVNKTITAFGRLDVLVNNAALHPPPMFDFNEPDWKFLKRMIDVNILGIIICSHEAKKYLKDTNGNIVNVVMDCDAGGIDYTMTKTVGTPLTRGLARELAPLRVNAVSPGAIDTWGMTKEEKDYWVKKTLLKRVGNPLDIAQAIFFLSSDDASYITGATLQVDGGTRLLL